MKTQRIDEMLEYFVVNKSHHKFRQPEEDSYALAEKFSQAGLSDMRRSVERFRYVLEKENPVVFMNERIAMLRTTRTIPEIHTKEEDSALREEHAFLEKGRVFNICPDYAILLGTGLDNKAEEIRNALTFAENDGQKEFLESMLDIIEIIKDFAERYRAEAIRVGNMEVAEILSRIPANSPDTFLEALAFLRILHYCLWCNGNYHNTFGRIDQFLYPYYKHDIENGVSRETLLEELEEFYISCNRDSDLYIGLQQGDNGQTVVLGGKNADGSDAFNELSELCLIACRDLCLIDPKINLRVHRNTSIETYDLASTLTAKGLGFPQYTNDEVIIPALLRWGYDVEDAYNYSLAACWEIIIPGYLESVNWDSLSFLQAVKNASDKLNACRDYSDFKNLVFEEIRNQAEAMMSATKNCYKEPSPYVSIMSRGCLETRKDVSEPGKYNAYGFHGDGLSNAVDSMAAIRKYVFEDKVFTSQKMCEMLKCNFMGYEKERNLLRYQSPKFGNDDDSTDEIASELLACYADSLEGKRNDRGGIFRPGTASAMYYIWHSKDVGATADGRDAGEAVACNYSPSLFARCEGPVSIIESFSKPDLVRVANGGPLTIELSDTMFRSAEAIHKCAMYVKSYMDLGGHQMQINSVNRDRLLDAQKHPENYRNLIVRVWGWSGYFVELNEVYQNHIIKRSEMVL